MNVLYTRIIYYSFPYIIPFVTPMLFRINLYRYKSMNIITESTFYLQSLFYLVRALAISSFNNFYETNDGNNGPALIGQEDG